MIWANIAPTLTSVVKSVSGLTTDPLWNPTWLDAKQPFTSPVVKASVALRIPASRALFDERRVTSNPTPSPGSELLETQHGLREFTLNVLCKAHSQAFAAWAHETAERVRTRIQRRSVRGQLLAAGVVLVEAGPITDIPLIEDKRAVSYANLDLRMRAAFEDEAEALTWIETIELTGQIKNTAGVTYASPPNITGAVMPSS